jgi:hypothetical protein
MKIITQYLNPSRAKNQRPTNLYIEQAITERKKKNKTYIRSNNSPQNGTKTPIINKHKHK